MEDATGSATHKCMCDSHIMRILLFAVLVVGRVLGYSAFNDVTKMYGGGQLNYSVYTGFVEIEIAEDQKAKCSMFYQYVTK